MKKVSVCVFVCVMCIAILLLDICFHSFYRPGLLYKGTLYMTVNLEHARV